MEDSFAKVMSLAAFIVLGHLLRRFNILKDQAFAAISALVMNVTLPCVILTNLNGVRIEGDMLLIAGLGLLTNIIFLVWGLFLSRNIADTQWRDFVRLNVGGYSVGPFAVRGYWRSYCGRWPAPPSSFGQPQNRRCRRADLPSTSGRRLGRHPAP